MPELPEVESLSRALAARLVGRRLERCDLASFAALKTVEPPLERLVGATVTGVGRRGKFLCVATDGPWLIVHLARGGWVRLPTAAAPGRPKPGPGPLALRLRLDDGGVVDVTEHGTEKRLALWVVADPSDVPPVAALGPDPLDPTCTPQRLGELLTAAPATLKVALTTQSVLAGVGNAYSDEILHAARLSPYKKTTSLTAADVERLHAALVGVLTAAVDRSDGVGPADLKGDKHRAMSVHGRTGEACPVCGDTVRQVAFATRSLQYCPTCQTGGRVLADRRLSRLLR